MGKSDFDKEYCMIFLKVMGNDGVLRRVYLLLEIFVLLGLGIF